MPLTDTDKSNIAALVSGNASINDIAAEYRRQQSVAAIQSQKNSPNAVSVPPPSAPADAAKLMMWLTDGTGADVAPDILNAALVSILQNLVAGTVSPADTWTAVVQNVFIAAKMLLNSFPEYQKAAAAAVSQYVAQKSGS